MRFRTDFKFVKWRVSINDLLPFQFCLNFGNLCIYRGISSTLTMAVAPECFCFVEISVLQTFHYKGIELVLAVSISFAAIFTLVTLKPFVLC